MKRLLLVVLVLIGGTSIAQAATPSTRPGSHDVGGLVAQAFQSVHKQSGHGAATRRLHAFRSLKTTIDETGTGFFHYKPAPLSAGFSSSQTSGSDLALPADVVSSNNGVQLPVSSGQGPFANYHQSNEGFQSAVAAEFDAKPVASLFYQGSVFNIPASAQSYMNESATLTTSYSSVAPTDCSKDTSVPCKIIGFKTTSGQLVLYSVALVNYCVIEAGLQGDPNLINQNLLTVTNAESSVFVLGIQEAKAACTGPDPDHPQPQPTPKVQLSLVKVQFEKAKLLPASNNPKLGKVKHGATVHLSSYYLIPTGPPSVPVTEALTLTRNGHTVRHGTVSGSVSPGNQPSWGFFALKLQKAGTFKGTVTITAGDKLVTGSATIKVK